MTTDPFIEAARAEARRRMAYHDRQFGSLMPPMLHMAEWARTHLAAQEPTDAEVEAACAGFYNDPSGLTDWTKLARVDPALADRYRAGIRRALSAARRDEEEHPQLGSPTRDCGRGPCCLGGGHDGDCRL